MRTARDTTPLWPAGRNRRNACSMRAAMTEAELKLWNERRANRNREMTT